MQPQGPLRRPSRSMTCSGASASWRPRHARRSIGVAVIRRGIPSSAVDALTKLTHLSRAELWSAVGIPGIPELVLGFDSDWVAKG